MSSASRDLSQIDSFSGLSADDLALLEARLLPLSVPRGAALVREGDDADALYVVVSGRFSVEVLGRDGPVAEIGAGAPIGEIAFFAGGARTATVSAIRDSVVVRLTRADFDEIAAFSPSIARTITAALARRLARETRRNAALTAPVMAKPRARTIAIMPAGTSHLPANFLRAFASEAQRSGKTLIITADSVAQHLAQHDIATLEATRALNDLERRYETVVFIAGPTPDAFSDKAIHQADEILLIAVSDGSPVGSSVPLTELEHLALAVHSKGARRVALVYPTRQALQGTRHWLKERPAHMHHHVALDQPDDMARLWRFLRGEALGLVACGGGAYCSAHIGLYKAFRERGIGFDFLGGTSGGAAMAAAFAQDLPPEDIDARVHRMFITGKALARYTLPRYSLIDHTHFDQHLIAEYGHTQIEDLWKPYFAVSADLSDYRAEVHRSGPVWQAIRASAAIPALLPPFYTSDGRMLVDGSVLSNVPVEIMHALKAGPNVVVNFSPPTGERFGVDYDQLPARRDLLMRTLNPFRRSELPSAPSASTVLVRSLMANRSHFERQIGPGDWLLTPPTPADMGALDWRRHSELADMAYHYTLGEIDKRKSAAP